jgi:hypothetical protein
MSSKNHLEATRRTAQSFDSSEKARPYPRDTDARRQASDRGGPKTDQGKERSRLNATRHGLTGQITVMTEEDRAAHDTFCQALIKDLAPSGAMQQQLANRVAEDSWRLNRISAIEENIFAIGFDNYGSVFVDMEDPQLHATMTATVTFARDADQFKLLSLYEQRLNRSVEKNLKLLRQLQADEQAKLETKTVLREKALEEARLLYGAESAACTAAAAAATNVSDENPTGEQAQSTGRTVEVNGFVFSSAEIAAAFDKNNRLQQARKADSTAASNSANLKTHALAA